MGPKVNEGVPAGKRRYESLRRDAAARQTRADIAEAARELFVRRGWAATTMRDVAEKAGVSAPTVYAAYRSKEGLVWALADSADLTAGVDRMLDELEAAVGPAGQLAAMAAYDRRLFEQAGDLIGLVREAGRTEPDLANLYREGRSRADRVRRNVLGEWPPGTLRPGLSVETAVDVYAGLCNIDVYNTFTIERAWRPEDVERWWGRVLSRELLAGSAD